MDDRFTKEEIVQKGSMPYFPLEKIAKLLDIEVKAIHISLIDAPEILDRAIVVDDFHTGEKEMYFSPLGCIWLIDILPEKLIGKKVKQMSKLIMNGTLLNLTVYVKRLVRISPPILKALYEWSDIGERYDFDQEHEGGPEPVQ